MQRQRIGREPLDTLLVNFIVLGASRRDTDSSENEAFRRVGSGWHRSDVHFWHAVDEYLTKPPLWSEDGRKTIEIW